MSIKDLFSKKGKSTKVIVAENAVTASQYVEAVQTVKAKYDLNNQFVPHIDFATASNFAKFGSAELYYEFGFKRIYNEYPYDGTEREKIEFRLSSSYLDDYIFENLYPRVNGYVQFSAQGTTSTSVSSDGYGKTSTPEYIFIKGGPHTASGGMIGNTIVSKFHESNYYDPANDLGSSLELKNSQGTTVEFWLKKSSFSPTDTEKEVIFDLFNNGTAGSTYGRLTIALTASATNNGENPFIVTLISGSDTVGMYERQIPIPNFTTASVADGNWHHYAFTFLSKSSGGIETKFYVDGVKKATDNSYVGSFGDIQTIDGNIATIGGLVAQPYSQTPSNYVTGSGKLNAYMDEFRYWKKSRTDKQIANSFFIPLGGGNNENDYNRKLGVYYKFNEGITGTSSTDSVVLDYSGRIANGDWTGYISSARSTGSALVESGIARSEFKDPIIYSYHPDVVSTLATLKTTGSLQDNEGTSKLISLMPGWLQEEDADVYDDQIKKFLQILASYFDNLNAQLGELSSLRDEEYPQTDEEPYFFARRLVESRGLVVPDFFTDGDLINYLLQKDDNEIFEQNISDVKNRIYHNIYNNLTFILKSKGTEKSFRNLLRCFGIDSEVVRLNLYADDGTYVIQENYEDTSVEKKFLNLNNRDNFEGTIYNVSSSNTSFTYISSSEGSQEQNTALTVECETFFPLKLTKRDDGYFPTTFLTSSIYGFHRALTSSAASYTWHPFDTDIQVYAIRTEEEGKDGYFVLTSSLGFEITSSTYFNLYDNNKWNFAVRVRNQKYPYTYGLSGSTGADYFIEFVGYNSIGDYVQNNFSLSSSISNAIGKKLLCNSKRLYAGAHRTNFTGSTLIKSDVLVSDVKYWQSYLDDETIKLHSYNPDNVGTKTPFRPDNVNTGIENLELTDVETLALHWRMDTQTTSDSSGEFTGFDFASGSSNFSLATATLTIDTNPTDGDTLTFGDGSKPAKTYTFKNTVTDATTQIKIAGAPSLPPFAPKTRVNVKAKLESDFDVSFDGTSATMTITNNFKTPQSNFTLSETFTAASNVVSGFSGFEVIGGNASRNSWLGGITGYKYPFKGQGFITSSAKAFDKRFVYSAKQRKFGVLMSSDGITIKDDANTLLFTDDDVSDNFYAFEKSYSGVISEEMLKLFASLVEFNDLIGQPIDGYKRSYKEIEKLSRLFFEKVENRIEPEKFFDFYRWIDNSIMFALKQLFPASAKYSDTSRNIIESHLLERNKYDRKFPLLVDVTATEGYAKGISELLYNWKFGHAPIGMVKATATISISDAGGIFNADTFTLVDFRGFSTTYTINGGVASADGGGSGGSATVGFDGVGGGVAGKVRAAAAIAEAINKTTDAGYTAVSDGVDTVTITQNEFGEEGNKTNSDSISSTTVSNFTGGVNKYDTNCFWQKHRRERTDITDRQTVLDSLNNGNNVKHLAKLTKDGTIYAGSTYALRNFTNLSKFSVEMDKNIHGGINYSENKNRDAVWDATYIHGPTSRVSPKGIPQNVLVVGLGEGQGTEAFIDCADEERPNEKRKWRFTTVTGRRVSTPTSSITQPRTDADDYRAIVKGELTWPANLISASVTTGYQSQVASKFKQGVVISNLHSDTYAPGNEIGMQGPFTETWVGGHQSRHVNLNKFKGDSGITVAGANATAIITIVDQPSAGDKLTFGDGISGPTEFTFAAAAISPNQIYFGDGLADSRIEIKNKLETNFNVTATINGNNIEITNNNFGTVGNVTISETFTSSNNTVSGFSGGIDRVYRTRNNLDGQYTREEGWRLLLRECPDPKGSGDGAMGFVGPDYGGPYPDASRKYAVRYRAERAKRPLNVKNIRTTTSSVRAGNFVENYEIFNTTGRLENRRGPTLTTGSFLSPFYSSLPQTTQEASLIGIAASKATATITIADTITANDTLTFGDGVLGPDVFTFVNGVNTGTFIIDGSNLGAPISRAAIKAKLEARYDVSITIDGNNLNITNNNFIGQRANVTLSSSFTTASNLVSGFEGAQGGAGNLVSVFNGSNRIPSQIFDQQVFDPNVRSNSIIATRFSAPGGFETMSEIYLDVPSKEYSAYNAMPFRNLMVRGSGSGEAGTIRLNDIHGNRFGLQTHLRRHSGQFGFDSVVGSTTTKTNYVTSGSFHKVNRNRLIHLGNETKADYTAATSSQFDNGFVTHQIPRSDYQNSWITSSLAGDRINNRFYGFAPENGFVSSSANGIRNAYNWKLKRD